MINMWLLFAFVTVCLYTDLRERKIYNHVVLGGVILASFFNILQFGLLDGFLFTLTGLFTGIFLLVIPFIFGGLGAGDVKMLGMVGAFAGYLRVMEILLVSAVLGGVIAIAVSLQRGGLLWRSWKIITGLVMFVLTRKYVYMHTLRDPGRDSEALPYGAAISLGVIIVYILGSMNYSLPGFGAAPF